MLNKTWLFLLTSLLAQLLGLSTAVTVKAEQRTVTLAYLENGLRELKTSDRQIALQLLANELVKGTNMDMVIRSVPSYNEMQQLIANAEVDYVILNSYHYLKHTQVFMPYMTESIWAIQRGLLPRENYILVTQKRYAGQDLTNFEGRSLSLHAQYLLLGFYLEYLVRQAGGVDSEHFFSKIKQTKTASQGILDVYFGTTDLCIVPKHIFELTIELNPALREHLVIMHESGPLFLPVLVFAFKHLDTRIDQQISANLASLEQSARGEQILDMFSINAIRPVQRIQLQPMQALFQKYQTLISK